MKLTLYNNIIYIDIFFFIILFFNNNIKSISLAQMGV